MLLSVAEDSARPAPVRRAAMLGLALGKHVEAVPVLVRLIDAGDRQLARTARIALGVIADGGLGEAGRMFDARGPMPDDALGIVGTRIEPEALLSVLEAYEPIEGDDVARVRAATLVKGADTPTGSAEDSAHAVTKFVPVLGDSGGGQGWDTRLREVLGLARMMSIDSGARSRSAEDALFLATLDGAAIVRAEAGRALRFFASPRVRRRLQELGRDRSAAVRAACRLDLAR